MDSKKPSKMRILLRSVNSATMNLTDALGGNRNNLVDFHIVVPEDGKIISNCLPPMLTCVGPGNMVILGQSIYVVGGVPSLSSLAYAVSPVEKFHKGGSCCDLEGQSNKCWAKTAIPAINTLSPNSAPILGKIYSFGFPFLTPEFYDPNKNEWKKLGSLPSVKPSVNHMMKGRRDIRVSLPVLPDPANSRALVHMYDTSEIYAFYPPSEDHPEGVWTILATGVSGWENSAKVVVNNIILFHDRDIESSVSAFDLTSGCWLDVEWSPYDLNGVNVTLFIFDALIPCPENNEVIWMLGWSQPRSCSAIPQDHCGVKFLKFCMKRTNQAKTLTLTPLLMDVIILPSSIRVYDFLPLVI